ncbi:MAG: SulP family inorganic anion transporter [Alphaproteobacteria bacterium]|nr:MAG: SulP family inorganic anion transporter [Alphaproteobacteria bacterium]
MSLDNDLNWLNPKNLKNDIASGIVVFLVALPLCLGIALASGANLFSGIIAGIVGGTVLVLFSNSPLGVSGPAAGLAAVVLDITTKIGSFPAFLSVVVLAGVIQIIFGLLKGGVISHFFPSSVIKGLLAGIGLVIIQKQIPVLLGVNSYSDINLVAPNIATVGFACLIGLIVLEFSVFKKMKFFKIFPASLVMVLIGTLLALFLNVPGSHLVSLPVASSVNEFVGFFQFPDFSQLANKSIYLFAFTLAIVASIETLLSVEASDKLDPFRRTTDTNKELIAQGIGNMTSGLLGGLPITQVVVRSSVNVNSGGKTKMASMLHGILLLTCVSLAPAILNYIPLATLAAILILTGYKLTPISLYKKMIRTGKMQFISFLATALGIVTTDLLKGIMIGLCVAVVSLLYKSYTTSYFVTSETDGEKHTTNLRLAQEVSFLNKGSILKILNEVPEDSRLTIDLSHSLHIDYDVREIIKDFTEQTAKLKNVETQLIR